ncbi:MAG: U32 family peptidase [Proteobacteria bacterium]|nr:U32 family peptidase [Pseudomonadota bacterium]MBU1686228.1 U32 family peptidase [Pseudomonadota bacterium]
MSSRPELLAPAGNLEKLKTAIHYGADAVYLGGQEFSLRAHATNFTNTEIDTAVAYAHTHGVKVYVTVNILAHHRDFASMPGYLATLGQAGVDGLIIADPGILSLAQKEVPELPIHLSTQANVTNAASARFWQDQGVKRINAARELSLEEIAAIKDATDLEIEVFVHGALCISYSGRCLLSSYLTGRSANRGECAHPCRYSYALVEEKRPGQYFPVEEDGRGTYIFNSKDLCLLNRIPELLAAGIDSLKIEGRMKTVAYVGGVVRVYRAAIDELIRHGADPSTGQWPNLPPSFMEELQKVGTRGVTENFFNAPPGATEMLYLSPRIIPSHEPVGIIEQEGDPALIEIRNPLFPGETVEHLGPGLSSSFYQVKQIKNEDGDALDKANPGNRVHLITEPITQNWRRHDLLRRQTRALS